MQFGKSEKSLSAQSALSPEAVDPETGGDTYLYGSTGFLHSNSPMPYPRLRCDFAFTSRWKPTFRDRSTYVKLVLVAAFVLLTWRVLKMFGPPGTGLEGMPAYGESLGCDDSRYFQGLTFFEGYLHPEQAQHSLDIRGAAVGTVHILQGDSDSVKYEMQYYTDSSSRRSQFAIKSPRRDDVVTGRDISRVELATPLDLHGTCMRYDMKVILPPQLKELHIRALSTTQIKMSPLAEVSLDKLVISLYGNDRRNMLLVSNTFRANLTDFELTSGWIVGSTQVLNKTVVTTQLGDAVTDLHVAPSPVVTNGSSVAELETTTGAGRTNILYNRKGSTRPIHSSHRSWHRAGDMYLDYTKAAFNGKVNIVAKSFSAPGIKHSKGAGWMFVGEEDIDTLIISSKGWVGLDLGKSQS
ncbi:unnamed protein product [Somion occarium]|uniref:Uncharacterized protein n=1 Tax=Somion occarium TaxID=3059160 RepID=A0ABP1DHR0_9APHY